MSFIVFERARIYWASRPLKLPKSVPFPIGELSCVAASISVGLYTKTMLQTILPLTSVTLPSTPLEVAFAMKLAISELSDIAITVSKNLGASTILHNFIVVANEYPFFF